MDTILLPLGTWVRAWLDDLLANAANESGLLKVHLQFSDLCRVNGLLLHAEKCAFFCERTPWCGRLISAAGIKYDPRHFQGLVDMPLPTTGAHLMQFVCAMGWLRTISPSLRL
jgi:hypothetical protein